MKIVRALVLVGLLAGVALAGQKKPLFSAAVDEKLGIRETPRNRSFALPGPERQFAVLQEEPRAGEKLVVAVAPAAGIYSQCAQDDKACAVMVSDGKTVANYDLFLTKSTQVLRKTNETQSQAQAVMPDNGTFVTLEYQGLTIVGECHDGAFSDCPRLEKGMELTGKFGMSQDQYNGRNPALFLKGRKAKFTLVVLSILQGQQQLWGVEDEKE